MCLSLFEQCEDVFLEVEVAPAKVEDFINRYTQITNLAPDDSYYQEQPNKWGTECRIYFNASVEAAQALTEAGCHVEEKDIVGYRPEYAYRINQQDLFWNLVSHGYRLGPDN
ncbi:MAG: hypothetical protein KAJ07_07620 [Planctomycetes bacterium]|nr:hypothetical protein [Planctomycetota bacterium]